MFRGLTVVVLSLAVFGLSAITMYGIWTVASMLTSFWRAIAAVFGWVVVFGIGSKGFWKIIENLSADARERSVVA